MFRQQKLLFAAIPFLIGISLWLQLLLPAEGDKGWLLHVARLWLNGNSLYTQIAEVNPPFILCIYVIPVWLSVHFPFLQDYQVLTVLGLFACVFSIGITSRIMRLHPMFAGKRSALVKFGLLEALIFIFYTQEAYFFDREHIFIVMAFPYLLQNMPSLAEKSLPLGLRIVTGCMAAFGFCIKPHTALIFLCVQCFAFLRTRSFKMLLTLENCIIAGAGIFYIGVTALLAPEYFRIFVPMAWATYDAFRNPQSEYIYLPAVILGLIMTFAGFRRNCPTPYRRDAFYLLGLVFACLLYAEINNGWGYTYHPLCCMQLLLTGWMIWHYRWLEERRPARKWLLAQAACVSVFIVNAAYILLYVFILGNRLDGIRMPCADSPECLRENPFNQYFLDHDVHSFESISFDFSRWVELARRSGVRWDNRFNHLWMLPELYIKGPAYMTRYRWIVDYAGKAVADDLARKKPEVVFIDVSPGMRGYKIPFDLASTLSTVPEFKEEWSHYRYQLSFDDCPKKGRSSYAASECSYALYRRIQ